MAKIRINLGIVLIIIIIIQFIVIGWFSYTNKISNVSTSRNVTAIIEKDNERYLLIHELSNPRMFNIDSNARYLNHDGNAIHLFDESKMYMETLNFDSRMTNFNSMYVDDVEYRNTSFKCKKSICMLNKSSDVSDRVSVQVFSVKGFDFVYLDADHL